MIESIFDLLRDLRIAAGATILLMVLMVLLVGWRAYRRYRKSRTPYLEIMDTGITKPAYSSNAGYFSFRIVNTRGGRAEILEIELTLADSGASKKARELQAGKVVDKYDLVAKLRSDRRRFKLARKGESAQKTVLARAEAKKYRIKLESDEYHWYRFWVKIKWRDARDTKIRVAQSRDQYIEFTVV